MVDFIGSYVTVSTKVRREVVERAKRLGINLSEFPRRKLKEKVEGEVELITRRLRELREVPDAINIERVVRHVREDRVS